MAALSVAALELAECVPTHGCVALRRANVDQLTHGRQHPPEASLRKLQQAGRRCGEAALLRLEHLPPM